MLTLLATAVISLAVLWRFLFGSKVLLFTDVGIDTYYAYYPFYYLLAEYVSALHIPAWSFQLGMGTSVLTLYHFLYDPFAWIHYALGVDRLARSLAWVYVLKLLCCAWFTYLYARYLHLHPHVRVLAALLYAFNGFLMVWGQHYFFASWIVFLPLLLFAVERYFREGRWLLLSLLSGWMMISITIFYQVVIFCFFYVLMRYFWARYVLRTPIPARRMAGLVWFVMLGMGVAAVAWLPNYYLLSSNPRLSASPVSKFQELVGSLFEIFHQSYYISLASRVFSSNLQGVGEFYTGFFNYYESLQLYGGLLSLLVLPQAFVVLPRNGRWLLALGLALGLAAIVFPTFGAFMNGLQYPAFRWGYGLILFLVLLAAVTLHAMATQRRVHVPLLLASLGVLSTALVALWWAGTMPFSGYVRVLVLLAVHAALVVWWVRAKPRSWPFALLLLSVCLELVTEHRPSFNRRDVLAKSFEQRGAPYHFDGAFEAMHGLRAADPSFFRVDRSYGNIGFNGAAVQGYRGTDSYNSLNTPAYVALAKTFKLGQPPTTIFWNSVQHPYLADIAGVKYHLAKGANAGLPGADLRGRYDDVAVYERLGALPFGFVYDAYVSADLLRQLSLPEQERVMLHAAVVEGNARTDLAPLVAMPAPQADDAARQARRAQVVRWQSLGDERMSGQITLARGGLLFLSIPFDPGWSATVDGQVVPLQRVNIGFSGLQLPAGAHQIVLAYRPPYLMAGLVVSLLSLGVLGLLVWRGARPVKPLLATPPARHG